MRLQLSPRKKNTGTTVRSKPLQRSPAPGKTGQDKIPPGVDSVLQSPGEAMPSATRQRMESRLGHSFNNVRVHDDTQAAHSAQSLGAKAYTVGNHIVFGEGHYNPDSTCGQKLLAHELTHVHQQNTRPMFDLEDESAAVAAQDQALEQEAEMAEQQIEEGAESGDYIDEPGLEGDAPHPDDDEIAASLEDESEEGEEEEEAKSTAGTGISLGIAGMTLGKSLFAGENDNLLGTPPETDEMTDKKKKPPVGKKPPGKGTAKKDDKPKEKGKRILIDLDKQTATALEDGKPVKTMKISSGKASTPTNPGKFKIYERDKDHKSSTYGKCVDKDGKKRDTGKGAGGCKKGEKYQGAPMKYFQRFNGGEGLHKGILPGHPDSHGCVRLSEDSAKWLWDWAEMGTPVHVVKAPKKAASKKAAPKKKK